LRQQSRRVETADYGLAHTATHHSTSVVAQIARRRHLLIKEVGDEYNVRVTSGATNAGTDGRCPRDRTLGVLRLTAAGPTARGVGRIHLAVTEHIDDRVDVKHPSTNTGRHHHREPLRRAEHAQWVTHDKKTNTNITHDEIRGTVTTVSATSISVKAADGTTETYSVSSATKVHAKGDTKTSPGTISQVKTGDEAIVIGTGPTNFAAIHILDRGAPKTTSPTTTPTK